MANIAEYKKRLKFWKNALEKLQKAYYALIDGGVKSYQIDNRQLTKLDLATLKNEIKEAESNVNKYTALANGKSVRKAMGVIPRDW